jgi:solute carrier family 35 (UDP-sugar transporter), member A1/2/3
MMLDSEKELDESNKWTVLMMLILAHAALTIGLRVEAAHFNANDPVINSTVVCVTEVTKLVLSFLCVLFVDASTSCSVLLNQCEQAFVENGPDLLKLCVPAVLYSIQNNLQYVIETNPFFIVLYDFKVLTTAIFYTFMLNHRISLLAWISIIVLIAGMGMVQSSEEDIHVKHVNNKMGLAAVFFACLTSGFAGVYFEKIMKGSKSSIWMINLQMSMLSSCLTMLLCLTEDTEDISARGFFAGYNESTVLMILLQAVAGLSITLVVKFADNVYKGFATGIAYIISWIIDHYIFEEAEWGYLFCVGTFFIVSSFSVFASVHTVQTDIELPLASKDPTRETTTKTSPPPHLSSSSFAAATVMKSRESIVVEKAPLLTNRDRSFVSEKYSVGQAVMLDNKTTTSTTKGLISPLTTGNMTESDSKSVFNGLAFWRGPGKAGKE